MLMYHLKTGFDDKDVFNPAFFILSELLTSTNESLMFKMLEAGIIENFYEVMMSNLENQ